MRRSSIQSLNLALLAASMLASPAIAQETLVDPAEAETDGRPEETERVEDVITVTGYRGVIQTGATRTNTPLGETPVAVQVIPEDLIRDQAAIRLRDAYRNVSGVQASFTSNNVASTEAQIVRGFVDGGIYRDGFRIGQIAAVDFTNVERIEVLKGPASTLYGLGQPGGLVNIVTKKAENDRFLSLYQEIGSFDRYRTLIDANAPLSGDGSVLGRLNLSYTSDGSFRDHRGTERVFIAPALTWQITPSTRLVMDASYSYEEYPFDSGLVFGLDGEPVADISTFLGEPDFRSEREEFFFSANLTHEFSENVTFRSYFLYQENENRLNAFRLSGQPQPDGTIGRTFDRSIPTSRVFQTVNDLLIEFETGSLKHNLLVGGDVRYLPSPANGQDGPRTTRGFPIDIVNPQYGQFGEIVFNNQSEFDQKQFWTGVFIQDQITTADDRLHILVGGRFDYVEQFVFFETPSFFFEGDQNDTAFTGRFGLLYELTDWASPYVNVAQSFNPTSPFSASIDGLDPETGVVYEGGVKFSLFNDRVSATTAVYQITKENVPVADPDNPGFSRNGGRQRSQGFELDVAGEILPGWNIIATYAYIDTEVLASDFLPIGGRFTNVPLNSGSLWTAYDFPDNSPLANFGFGAGVFAQSDRAGDGQDSFQLDGFARVDASFWYQTELPSGAPLRAQINVNNVFDTEYYENSSGIGAVFPGEPLSVIGSLRVTF